MPRDLPRFVARKVVKGRVYTYFRWREVYRRLPNDPASEAFRIEYARALASISPEHERPVIGGSVRALLRDFKSSPEWSDLAPKTQADYARVLDHLRPIGEFQADNVRRQHVIRLRNKMNTNRRTQDLFVAAVSRMFTIGMDLGYTDRNPAARIERLNDPESYSPWSLEARQKFEASALPDWLRTAYMLALWTGQRESDVLRLARAI
jgi:integrase